jgi:hypothetical protein
MGKHSAPEEGPPIAEWLVVYVDENGHMQAYDVTEGVKSRWVETVMTDPHDWPWYLSVMVQDVLYQAGHLVHMPDYNTVPALAEGEIPWQQTV